MGTTITFDPTAFVQAFPEFQNVPPARLTFLFGLASSTLLDNTGAGPVNDPAQLLDLFWLLVAHLLALFGPSVTTGGQGGGTAGSPGAPVGRLDSATQGSVSSSFAYDIPQNPSAPWFVQTKYGATYWLATAQFRSARYIALGNSGTGFAKDFLAPPFRLPGGI
jgi:hypothetical protein